MSSFPVSDPGLPGLGRFFEPSGQRDLAEAVRNSTNGKWLLDQMDVVRFRHRPGKRAIIQLDTNLTGSDGNIRIPAALWMHSGGKSAKIERKIQGGNVSVEEPPRYVIEPNSGALLQFFPFDYRVPQVGTFFHNYPRFARTLLNVSGNKVEPPQLARFRPGLGATFRWQARNQTAAYVKIFPDKSDVSHVNEFPSVANDRNDFRFELPRRLGTAPEISAVAIEGAKGESVERLLSTSGIDELNRVSSVLVGALADFHSFVGAPEDQKSHLELVRRSKRAASLICFSEPDFGGRASALSNWIESNAKSLPMRPAHMDMKTEHLFVTAHRCTILDTDSMALSDPLFDFVMLEMRMINAAICEQCSMEQAIAGASEIRKILLSADRRKVDWLRAISCLQIGRHHAQRQHADRRHRIASILAYSQSKTKL